ncbi:MAG: hypothetical protein AAF065_01955 [Verrucomicrobiota bacterium]
MSKTIHTLILLGSLLTWNITAHASESSAPLLTVCIESYEELIASVNELSAAIGQPGLGSTLPMMIGPGVVKLVDEAKPWHAAVWMESMVSPPIIAVFLPITDFEAFEAAMPSTIIGQSGASFFDAGDSVLALTSSPGVPVPEVWSEKALAYTSNLAVQPKETIEVSFVFNEQIRAAAIGMLAASEQQLLASFDQSDYEATGMAPEEMKGLMQGYLDFYKTGLKETKSIRVGLGIQNEALGYTFGITPNEGSSLADLAQSQNVDISSLATMVDWDSDLAIVMGMADLPVSLQTWSKTLMEATMPFYGLETNDAAEWVQVIENTTPFRSAMSVDFDDGMTFSGFYEILDSPAGEVYENWIKLTESLNSEEQGTSSYYSKMEIKRGYRKMDGHEIDLVETSLNQGHPMFQLPEQKEAMDHFFKDGRFVYEMALVENRIYIATEGKLNLSGKVDSAMPAWLSIGPKTRMVFSMDFGAIMKMAMSMSGEPIPAVFSAIESGQALSTSIVEIDGTEIIVRSAFPLSILEAMTAIE